MPPITRRNFVAGFSLLHNGAAASEDHDARAGVTATQSVGATSNRHGGGLGALMRRVATMKDLRNLPVEPNSVVYLEGFHVRGDSGGGTFFGSSIGNAEDDGGITIIPRDTVAGTAWVRQIPAAINVRWFGARGDTETNDTSSLNAALKFCSKHYRALYLPDGGYKVDALVIENVRVFGETNTQYSRRPTLISTAKESEYGVTLLGGTLENITIKCDLCNGINVLYSNRQLALLCVTLEATNSVRESVGISFGSDDKPGTQAIASMFQKVTVRNFDTCFWMKYYSNANIYEDMYALNTTDTPSECGFRIEGRGGCFLNIRAESNFVDAIHLDKKSQMNTLINPWTEGTNTNYLRVNGVSNQVLNPFYTPNIVIENANSQVVGRTGTSLPLDAFFRSGHNMLPNSEFSSPPFGWKVVGSHPEIASVQIWGRNALELKAGAKGGLLQATFDISDPEIIARIAGKPVTLSAVGQKLYDGLHASIRVMIDAGGGLKQFGSSEEFPVEAPGLVRVSAMVPAGARALQFRVFGSGNPGGAAIARMALPMLTLGANLDDITARPAYDGANIFFGNQTLSGGDWDSAHLVLGEHHLWVDENGELRIKKGAPLSSADGKVVSQ